MCYHSRKFNQIIKENIHKNSVAARFSTHHNIDDVLTAEKFIKIICTYLYTESKYGTPQYYMVFIK